MTWMEFLAGTLATFRLALLVSREDGPAFVFRKLRRMPEKGTATKEGLSCTWCVSVYASALVTVFFHWQKRIEGQDWLLYWLAFSAAAICLNQAFTKGVK